MSFNGLSRRPLYDPDPDRWNPHLAFLNNAMRRCRLSDFSIVAFAVLIYNGVLLRRQVDVFGIEYEAGANLRATHIHDGRPALAPDGTVMCIGSESFPGNSGLPAGPWNLDNVDQCPGYEQWMDSLKRDGGPYPYIPAIYGRYYGDRFDYCNHTFTKYQRG